MDDKFWHQQKQTKSSILQLYKGYLREKYPRSTAHELLLIADELVADQTYCDPHITQQVITHLYDAADTESFMRRLRLQPNIKYSQLVKMVLDF